MKFDEIQERLKKYIVTGDLGTSEAKILYDLAYGGPEKGYIVEIGTYNGGSALFLGNGSMEGKRERVITIDNFGSHPNYDNVMELFLNLKQFDVIEHVVFVKDTSWEFARIWNRPIRLLYIDGAHDYESVKSDFFSFEPFVVRGGIIVLHDTKKSKEREGPCRFINEMIDTNKIRYKCESLETEYGISIITKLID